MWDDVKVAMWDDVKAGLMVGKWDAALAGK